MNCEKRKNLLVSVHHLGVEIPVLSVTPVPEASQDNGLLFLCPKQKQVQCRSWKDKPQAGEHPSQPKARERCNILVVQKTLESQCFRQEAVYTPAHVRHAQPTRWGHTHCKQWAQSTITIRVAGFWSGGDQPWAQSEEAEAPADPLEIRGKAPPLGERCAGPIRVPQVHTFTWQCSS